MTSCTDAAVVEHTRDAAVEIRMTGTNTAPLNLSDIERFIVGTERPRATDNPQPIDITGIVMLQIDSVVTGERSTTGDRATA